MTRRHFSLVTASLGVGWLGFVSLPVSLAGAEDTPVPAAETDFTLQGEYLGELHGLTIGVQVVALGDGKFSGAAYQGGLPGAGWDGVAETVHRGEGVVQDGVVTFGKPDGLDIRLSGGQIEVRQNGNALGTLKKTERQSPTLNLAAPEGALQLFAVGGDTAHWEKAQVDEAGLLLGGASSKEKWQGFKAHVEFRTPFQPAERGQAHGNSGVYCQGRYEVQVLDSFGLTGENNECGGLYGIAAPKVNMCLPPGQWQTYDIDFTAAVYDGNGQKTQPARVTVRHNGVLIHENVAVDHVTTAAPVPENPAPGPLYLQDHGNPVRYRNVWLLPQ